jgi:hypothetical protein
VRSLHTKVRTPKLHTSHAGGFVADAQDFDALLGRHAAANKLKAQKELEQSRSRSSLPGSLEQLAALSKQQRRSSLTTAFKEVLLSRAAVHYNLLLESRK